MENRKLQIIFPKDVTTDFLERIPIYLQEHTDVKITFHRLESISHHLDFLASANDLLSVDELILYMGHGMSNALSGASIDECSYGPFIRENELTIFKKRKIFLLTCRSNEYLQKYGASCDVAAGIGFPNMITDPYELIYPEEPDRVEGVSEEDIEFFKTTIIDTVKFSLFDFITSDLSFHQLYKRLKIRAQKTLINYYKDREGNGISPLGKMLYDFNDGISMIGN